MALNLSYDPIFSTQLLEESLFSSIKIDKNLDGLDDYWNFNWELKNSHDYRMESNDKMSVDIVDLLPSDPFGMDISASFTAWIDEIERDIELTTLGFGTDETEVKTGDGRLFAELNLVWNGAMSFYPEGGDMKADGKSILPAKDKEFLNGLYDGSLLMDGNIKELTGFSNKKYSVSSNVPEVYYQGCTNEYCDGDAPPDALFFALGYLGVRDLLSVEMVCKSLRDAVQNDPLLWKRVFIDRPLSDRITDDALLRLTSRAQGSLQCMSLVECLKITDSGLKRVFEDNPGLTKLCVPGCVRLSVDGILSNLKVFKSIGTPGIKHLRIGGLFGVTEKHFEELKFLLGADNHKQLSAHKPRFYHGGHLSLSFDDDCAIDIEACPRCQQVRQVYDCPAESCQGKPNATQLCRACIFCIARCINCGCCIDGREYEETFCLDLLCLDCWKQLLNCQEKQEGMSVPAKHSIFHQARYRFCFCG